MIGFAAASARRSPSGEKKRKKEKRKRIRTNESGKRPQAKTTAPGGFRRGQPFQDNRRNRAAGPRRKKKIAMDLQSVINEAFENRAGISPENADTELRRAVNEALDMLDSGEARVAQNVGGAWKVNEWLKKAVLLSFRIQPNTRFSDCVNGYYDKTQTKFADWDNARFERAKLRAAPGSVVRRGAFIGPNVVLMPSFVNVGAYVGAGTMVDTWATVGSCAQIGARVHLSGGVGVGGVLEPLQASPTIIEDDCFVGARSEIVEGVVVERGSVISMGVFIGQSTKIYDRSSGEVLYGRVPAGSVVVPGALPSKDGSHSLYCAVIVKRVDPKTIGKVSLNELLRAD